MGTCGGTCLAGAALVFGMTSSSQNLPEKSDVKIALRFHGAALALSASVAGAQTAQPLPPAAAPRSRRQGIAQRSVRRDDGGALAQAKRL